jgi:four helix bundle protein
MGDFRKLEVWNVGKQLAVYIYKVTGEGNFRRDFSLKDQIRRAAVSIPSNISEGEESGSDKLSIRYFNIAKGSSAEVQTQAEIAYEIGYISKKSLSKIISDCMEVSKKLTNLIKYRQTHLKPKT